MGSERREKTSREKIAEIRETLADVCVYEEDEVKEEIDHIELCQIYEDLTELNKRLTKIIELVKEEPTAAGDGSEISDEEAIEYLKILEKRMFDISRSAWLGDIPIGVIEVGINAIKNLQTFREKDKPGQVRYEDAVSRQAVFEIIDDCNSDGLKGIFCSYDDGERFKEYIKDLPYVTSTHGTCKDFEPQERNEE